MQNEETEIEIVECPVQYMVMYRHFMMSGGIFTYGSAEIDDYFPSFEKADGRAKELFNEMEGSTDLHVWIVQCLKTYCNGGIAIEKGLNERNLP